MTSQIKIQRKSPRGKRKTAPVRHFELMECMLPPFIIEEIKKREQEKRSPQRQIQPSVEVPPIEKRREENEPDGQDRGVIIIEPQRSDIPDEKNIVDLRIRK